MQAWSNADRVVGECVRWTASHEAPNPDIGGMGREDEKNSPGPASVTDDSPRFSQRQCELPPHAMVLDCR